ncbi:MAG: hypothetical protein JWR85_2427 [Marmoricola sp.]|nr:hypothetical protein [Marmoricola sp.]
MIAVLTPLMASMGVAALLVVVAIVFAETGLIVAAFLPGDSLLFTFGVLVAAHVVPLPLWLVVIASAAAAVGGDQVGYALGRRFGPRVFSRRHSRLLNPHHVDKAQEFFERHGSKAVVLARFVPVVRGFVPAVAGVGRMSYRRFAAYNVVGGVAWTMTMLLGGFYAGGIPLVAAHVELLAVALVALSLVPVMFVWVRNRLRRRGEGKTDSPESPTASPALTRAA